MTITIDRMGGRTAPMSHLATSHMARPRRSPMERAARRRLRDMVGLVALLVTALFMVAPGAGAAEKTALTGVVNVNTASAEELQLLPGVGRTRALAIVEQRESQGGFQRVEDLEKVKGIGPAMLEKMRPHVSLKGKTTARRMDRGKQSKSTRPAAAR